MKNLRPLLFLILLLPLAASSQDVKGVFKYLDKQMSFFGIDFTHLKCLGPDFKSGDDVKSVYFGQWNRILYEEGKYDLKGVVRARTINLEFSYVEKLNNAVDASKIINYAPNFLTITDIDDMIANYDYGEKTGTGIVFIADVYDGVKAKAYVHVVIFDLATHKVMLWAFIKGKPGGIGLRNYWSNAISDIMGKLKDDYYPKWESEFVK